MPKQNIRVKFVTDLGEEQKLATETDILAITDRSKDYLHHGENFTDFRLYASTRLDIIDRMKQLGWTVLINNPNLKRFGITSTKEELIEQLKTIFNVNLLD